MAKKKPTFKIDSFGIYSKWKRGSKALPKIQEFTTEFKVEEGKEFGIILHIKGGKGIKLDYCIKHPPFTDESGNIEPDFIGVYQVSSNDHYFYIGDCIWLPISDKVGKWIVSVEFEGRIIAEKSFMAKP